MRFCGAIIDHAERSGKGLPGGSRTRLLRSTAPWPSCMFTAETNPTRETRASAPRQTHMKHYRPKTLHALFVALALIPLLWLYYGLNIHDRGVGGDAIQFIATAYNITHHGVFSEKASEHGAPQPDAMRPPVYPLFLAGIMSVVPDFQTDDFSWFFDGKQLPKGPPHLKIIKYAHVFLLMLACLLAHYLTREITNNVWCAHAAFILTAVHPFLYRYVNRYYSELFTAFLVALFTALFYLCLKHRRRGLFALAGVTLGLLTLTKAQWYYIAIPCTAYFVFVGLLQFQSRRRLLLGALIFSLCFSATILPWKMRNDAQFGRSFITERGGTVLDLRSRYASMTNAENLASFFYWSRTGTIRSLLDGFMQPEEYANLVREQGYYNQALQRYNELEKQHPRAVADKMQFNEAARRLLANPWGYVKTLPALTYRGMVDGNISVFNLLIHALFWTAALAAVRTKRWNEVGIFLPTAMLIAFNSLVTHNISRYNATGTVLLMVGLVAGVKLLADRFRTKKNPADG